MSANDLLEKARLGDRAALGRFLSMIENDPAVLGALPMPAPGAFRLVGVTGPPGVGKSTLIARLALARAEAGGRVGVVAIDPTSPFSGGAFLGDRIRMNDLAEDDRIFIRSLASRGETGGLAPAALRVAEGLALAGYEEVFLETIGAGQSEVEIAQVADTRVVVVSAGSGDSIQAIKAGLLEIADVFVVNKDDEPGGDAAAAALSLAVRETGWKAPIVRASARAGRGIDEVLAALEAHRLHLSESGEGETRLASRRRFAFRGALRRLREAALAASPAVRDAEEAAVEGRVDPYAAAAAIARARFGHAALAPKDPEALARVLVDGLRLAEGATEDVPAEGVRVRFFRLAEGQLELLEPLGGKESSENPIERFIAKKGGGIHHIAIEVADFDETLARVRKQGIELAGEVRNGAEGKRVFFLHPKSTGGVLIEVTD